MKQQIRVIKTKRDYDAAMSRVSTLMDQPPSPDSEEFAESELLLLVIKEYERKVVAPITADPIESILFRMDQKGMAPKDLVPLIGSTSKVSEILSRKRPLSLSMIRALHKGLGIPAEILIASSIEEAISISNEPEFNFGKFPLAEMLERGCFPNFKGGVKALKEFAEELVSSFMRSGSDLVMTPALLRAPMHQAGSRELNEYSLLVWRICVLKKARAQAIKNKYVEGSITLDWLRDLVKLSRFDSGPNLAQEYLAEAGIALVIEPHFKRTYLDGAAMLDRSMPVVALTLRHDRTDNFWFALLHELIHIQKHISKKQVFITDNLDDKTRSSKQEDEADAGAREALIPSDEWKKSKVRVSHSTEDALVLAKKLRISPAIVAGRVRFETENWRLLSSLIGTTGDVSRQFELQPGGVMTRSS